MKKISEKNMRKIIPSGLLSLLILVFLSYTAFAGTSNTIPQYGFLPGVTAYAEIKSFQGPETFNGHCEINSYTSPATVINVIGWTWWQCDILEDGQVIDSITMDGDYRTASSFGDRLEWNDAFLRGNGLKAHGVHDFNHINSNPSPWQPYNVNVYP